jgi:hypothetical protein
VYLPKPPSTQSFPNAARPLLSKRSMGCGVPVCHEKVISFVVRVPARASHVARFLAFAGVRYRGRMGDTTPNGRSAPPACAPPCAAATAPASAPTPPGPTSPPSARQPAPAETATSANPVRRRPMS